MITYKIRYMEWVKTRRPVQYELGGSSVPPVSIDLLPEFRESVELNDFNLYGYRPLVASIADRYEVSPQQVVTTQGCSMANYLACAVLLRKGDEVLIEHPAYEPLTAVAELLGARIRRFRREFSNGYQIDVPGLARQISPHTKLIVLTNLHNPSGVVTAQEALREIGRIARRNRAFVLVDEVYLDFLFARRPRSAVHLGENFLVTSSLTKAYGLDGLRCGWVLAAPRLAKLIWRLQDFFGVNGAVPAEKAAATAFEHLDRFVDRSRRILAENRPVVDEFMQRHIKEGSLAWVAPDAGPVCFPQLQGRTSATAFTGRLLQDRSTYVVPGLYFEAPRHFRLGFGGPRATLEAGLRNISQTLRRNS